MIISNNYSDTQIIQYSHHTTAERIPVYDPTSTLKRQWDVKHAEEMKHITVLLQTKVVLP